MNDLATPAPNGLSTSALPAGYESMGKMDQEMLILHRAKLLQATSDEVLQQQFEGARPGLIINSITKIVLPDRFVPIFAWVSWMRFNARAANQPGWVESAEPGVLLWRSNDPNDPRVHSEETKFGPNGEPPLAITSLNVLSLFREQPMPLAIAFAKSSLRPGRELYSMGRFTGQPLWHFTYTLRSKLKTMESGSAQVFTVKQIGVSSEEERHQCIMLHRQFAMRTTIKVHEEEQETVEV